jgi:diacylglycerol kinase family enzyme
MGRPALMHVVVIVNRAARHARAAEAAVRRALTNIPHEIVTTMARGHAIELARRAVAERVTAVFAVGGDGTINEVINGLAGSDVPLGIVPGGSANVFARILDLPREPLRAAQDAVARLRSGVERRLPIGRVSGRAFAFCAGAGLDAEIAHRVESHPRLKRVLGRWFYLWECFAAYFSRFWMRRPDLIVTVGAQARRALSVAVSKASIYTMFGKAPIRVAPLAALEKGVDVLAAARLRARSIPRYAVALLRTGSHLRLRDVSYFHDVPHAVVRSDRPFRLQADGEYLGEHLEVRFECERDALSVLA